MLHARLGDNLPSSSELLSPQGSPEAEAGFASGTRVALVLPPLPHAPWIVREINITAWFCVNLSLFLPHVFQGPSAAMYDSS